MPDAEYLKTAEVAALFRVHIRQVDRWVKSGRIPREVITFTPGGHKRFLASAVSDLLAEAQLEVGP